MVWEAFPWRPPPLDLRHVSRNLTHQVHTYHSLRSRAPKDHHRGLIRGDFLLHPTPQGALLRRASPLHLVHVTRNSTHKIHKYHSLRSRKDHHHPLIRGDGSIRPIPRLSDCACPPKNHHQPDRP